MLTEIEWWGGLLFIWWWFCYSMAFKGYKDEPKFEVSFLAMNMAYLAAAIVLALYFYALENQTTQTIYVGAICIGVLATIIMFVWPETEESKAKTAAEKKEDGDEGEVSTVINVLAQVILGFPLAVSFGLGLYKSSGFVGALAFLGT